MIDRKLFSTLSSHPANDKPPSRPVFPLPLLDGQPPVLLIFGLADLAVAVAYEKHHLPGSPLVRATTRDTTLYCIPRPTPVLAVCDGIVIDRRKHGRSNHRLAVDHFGWSTIYSGLERVIVPPSNPGRSFVEVTAGELLGYLPATRAGPLRPLHFELWRADGMKVYEQIDPIRHMRRWQQLAWKDGPLSRATSPLSR